MDENLLGPQSVDRLVTVLMPVYNGAKYLRQQLDTILSDPLADPIIICDDASTDDSFELLKSMATSPRVILLRNDANRGVISTIEYLLGMVRSPFFALADQDDIWNPGRLGKCVNVLTQTGALLVYSDLEVVRDDLTLISRSRWRLSNQRPLRGRCVEPLIIKSPVNGCTVVARQRLLNHCLPFPTDIPMHDTWLAAVSAALGGLEFLNEQTVLYRQHSSNESGGASSYSVSGLIHRVRTHADGRLGAYSRLRLNHRMALLNGLKQKGLISPLQEKLFVYYSSDTSLRVFRLPFYLSVLVRRCMRLGLRNLATDVVMTVIPNRP
ncbi:MAG TPA: glycosyltransferase [Steroidobacteraceae bacterium]|jgi:glycosyltransferase involved in cell wall biosynthesis|nr:glycosyltransferase [Steroidobacteraceae bacterium]